MNQKLRSLANRWTLLIIVICIGILFHARLLQAVHGILVSEESTSQANIAVIMFGDHQSLVQASTLLKTQKVDEVWIAELRWPRTVELALAPSLGSTVKQELIAAGAKEEQLHIVLTNASTWHEALRILQSKLEQRSAAILCPNDRTRALRWTINQALPPETQRQLLVHSIPVYGYEESRWWLSRYGWKRVGSNLFRLGFLGVHGSGPAERTRWNPDDYERKLAAK